MTAGTELARQIADLTRRLAAVERGGQAKHSSYETATETVNVVDGIEFARAPIDGERLAGEVVLSGTRIIAGDPAAQRVELNEDGLRGFDAEGDPAFALVQGQPQFLSFIDPATGESLATIDDVGRASFAGGIDAANVSVAGEDIIDVIDASGRGIVAQGIWNEGGWSAYSDDRGLFEVAADVEPGRQYRVTAGPFQIAGDTANIEVGAYLRYTTNGASPEITSPEVVYAGGLPKTAGDSIGGLYLSASLPCTTAATWRFLACYASNGALARSFTTPTRQIVLTVEDIGPSLDNVAITNDGGGTGAPPVPPPALKKTYTKTYAASWSGSYDGSGDYNSFYGNGINQGYYSASNGNQRGMIGFPSTIATDLAGATINKLEVYVYFNHWFNNSGGTAVFGVHGATSRPGSFSGSANLLQSGGWPKPGGRWVTLPSSLHAGFASGAYRGIVIGPGPTTGAVYYGKANGVGASNPPALRATYTK